MQCSSAGAGPGISGMTCDTGSTKPNPTTHGAPRPAPAWWHHCVCGALAAQLARWGRSESSSFFPKITAGNHLSWLRTTSPAARGLCTGQALWTTLSFQNSVSAEHRPELPLQTPGSKHSRLPRVLLYCHLSWLLQHKSLAVSQ